MQNRGHESKGKLVLEKEDMETATPEPFCYKNSDCVIVGNKFNSMLEDESHHSKWEEFRRMVKTGSDHEECSQLLRRMELQDSDDEDEFGETDLDTQMTLEDDYMGTVEETVEEKIVEAQDKKQKRKTNWGSTKASKNLPPGIKRTTSFAFESNNSLNDKAACVSISLGNDNHMINHNVDVLRQKELTSRNEFINKNPEINLPVDLDIDLNINEFPSLNSSALNTSRSPVKENNKGGDSSWVKVVGMGLETSSNKNSNDDRSSMEH